ncbi:SEC-C metal-binding domain-containing protein [Tunturiibacter psychrotolerans]
MRPPQTHRANGDSAPDPCSCGSRLKFKKCCL